MYAQRTERGQALVLIILAIVGFFGFAALAVDGGRVYAERRRAQSAADSAAYAAAMAAVTGEDSFSAGFNQSILNGFTNDGLTNTVAVNNPPLDGPYAGDTQYYQVVITSEVEPIFAHFVYGGPMEVSAEAVAHARDAASASAGNAVHALVESGLGVEFKGNVSVHVNGGNIFSNSNGKKAGSSGNVTVTGGEFLLAGSSCAGCDSGISPAPRLNQDIQRIPDLPVPNCSLPAGTQGGGKLTPGRFPGGISLHGGGKGTVWTMDPGIYCISGDLVVNGGVELRGSNVLLVMQTGGIKLNGNGVVRLTRANSLTDASGQQWGGMLVYVPRGNTNEVFLSGGNNTTFSGTVYAPSSQCEVGGNVETIGLNANLICNNVVFHGTPDITINYKEPQNYRLPPMIELVE